MNDALEVMILACSLREHPVLAGYSEDTAEHVKLLQILSLPVLVS